MATVWDNSVRYQAINVVKRKINWMGWLDPIDLWIRLVGWIGLIGWMEWIGLIEWNGRNRRKRRNRWIAWIRQIAEIT